MTITANPIHLKIQRDAEQRMRQEAIVKQKIIEDAKLRADNEKWHVYYVTEYLNTCKIQNRQPIAFNEWLYEFKQTQASMSW